MKRLKKIAILISKALLSAIIVFLVLRKVNGVQVAFRVRSAGWFFPGAALICSFALLFLAARRWQVLSGGLLSYVQALKYTLIGLFYGAILPGAISGDLAKGASIAVKSKEARVAELPLSIVVDRVIGLYSLLMFFVVSCAILALDARPLNLGLERLGIYGLIAGASVLLLVACGVGILGKVLGKHEIGRRPSNRINALLCRAFDALQLYRHQPRLLLSAMGYSIVIHCAGIMSFYLLIRALYVDCRVAEVVIFYSMVGVLVSLPVTISGVGLRDWFSLTFFQSAWGDGHAGVAFAWLALALTLVTAMMGGIVQIADLFSWRMRQGGSGRRPA
jgi:uncharacterized protein (TIRG00374 family)